MQYDLLLRGVHVIGPSSYSHHPDIEHSRMKLVSVNVSRPTDVPAGKDLVRTAIFKLPVARPVAVGRLNLGARPRPSPRW